MGGLPSVYLGSTFSIYGRSTFSAKFATMNNMNIVCWCKLFCQPVGVNYSPVTQSLSHSVTQSLSHSVTQSLSHSVRLSQTQSDSVRLSQTQSDSVRLSQTQSDSVRLSQTQSDSVRLSQTQSDSVRLSQTQSDSVSAVSFVGDDFIKIILWQLKMLL